MISKEAKAAYDREYRRKNRKRLKAQKAAYFRATYDPVKAAKERKKRMPYHIAYCRQPWYRNYKREYDRRRRASQFGEFAEAYEALKALIKEINRQMPDRFERYAQSGRHQWNPINQQRYRRRNEFTPYSNDPEGFSLGNP
jgi:cell fate (sporulation/competence/biofilm development) regulator YlbF (YheA/YmcA/DUF963 family)